LLDLGPIVTDFLLEFKQIFEAEVGFDFGMRVVVTKEAVAAAEFAGAGFF